MLSFQGTTGLLPSFDFGMFTGTLAFPLCEWIDCIIEVPERIRHFSRKLELHEGEEREG